ncbi:Exosome complex component csl4 [Astathelohania contejeani]|uniref:Exosome complex component csl4 n=1 Tax=Astathelohania contejeani TaxID=164912 RepID=A0ABQ7HZD4_9MICR|nr:Exosome complex component csl4 [Thelohania contejeani]
MLKFPDNGVFLVTKNQKPVYYQPIPQIGMIVTCRIHKILPTQVHLRVTHVEDIPTKIEYQALLRLGDMSIKQEENVYAMDLVKMSDIIKGRIIAYGDHHGMFISILEERMGVLKP